MTAELGRRTARAAVIALAGVLAGGHGSSHATIFQRAALPASADSAAIVALEHTWLHTSDTTVLGRILAPDFVHIVPGGHFLTRAEHLAWVATHPHRPDVRRRFGALAVRLYGSVAIANGIVVVSDSSGRELGRSAFTDVFVRRAGRWEAVNAQEDVVRRSPSGERNEVGGSGLATAPVART